MFSTPTVSLRKGETPNETTLDLPGIRIWFSYETPIAFHRDGERRVVRENSWSTTTGKHLNRIDGGDKASRIDGRTFERELEIAINAAMHAQVVGA
ncbi:hypothetical protein SEA_DELAGARZA_35 [Microbacterium phage DelaGarza]|nr:hypothetical protein SEA_DELAGARZA_35 [Microbacterium phage DelaGarza]